MQDIPVHIFFFVVSMATAYFLHPLCSFMGSMLIKGPLPFSICHLGHHFLLHHSPGGYRHGLVANQVPIRVG